MFEFSRSQKTMESPLDAKYRLLNGQNLTVWTLDLCFLSIFVIGLSELAFKPAAFVSEFVVNFRKSTILTRLSLPPVAIRLSLQGLQSTVLMSELCKSLSDIFGSDVLARRSQMRSCRSMPTEHRMSADPGLKHRSSTLSEWPLKKKSFGCLTSLFLSGLGSFRYGAIFLAIRCRVFEHCFYFSVDLCFSSLSELISWSSDSPLSSEI